MNLDTEILARSGAELSEALGDLTALLANVTEAFSAALFQLNDTEVRTLAARSLSERFMTRGRSIARAGVLNEIASGGAPVQENYFEGDARSLGMYATSEPIRAYMAAPVGTRGVLWVDSRKTYRFTPKDLKVLTEFARLAERLLDRIEADEQNRLTTDQIDLIGDLLRNGPWSTHTIDDEIAHRLKDAFSFDGLLLAKWNEDKDLFQVAASAGFSAWVTRGRLIRRRPGWVDWSLRSGSPAIVSGLDATDKPAALFHAGERVGFPVRSFAVIPVGEETNEFLVGASRSPNRTLDRHGDQLVSLGRLLGLIRKSRIQSDLLNGIRRYDGESGHASEGWFRERSRRIFDSVAERRGSLVFLAVLIDRTDRLYLDYPHAMTNRFLEAFTDRLWTVTGKRGAVGKFQTGGFGLFVENVSFEDSEALVKRALALLGEGFITVDGVDIHYSSRIVAAHYPKECGDLHGMWEVVFGKLGLTSPHRAT